MLLKQGGISGNQLLTLGRDCTINLKIDLAYSSGLFSHVGECMRKCCEDFPMKLD